jgi:hypothetical protein
VAISSLSLEELGHLIKKKEKGKKDEVHDEQREQDNSKTQQGRRDIR